MAAVGPNDAAKLTLTGAGATNEDIMIDKVWLTLANHGCGVI